MRRSRRTPEGRRSAELADDAYHFALDLDLAGEDRLHLAVGRLESDALLFAEEALEGDAVVLEQRDHDVAVTGGRLWLDDHVVAIVDERVDHALPSHAQDIRTVARFDRAWDVEGIRRLRVSLDWLACGDLAVNVEPHHVTRHRHAGGH